MKARKTAETKDLLLASAKSLFAERGFSAVSTREIAEHAGVNLAAIQYHFGNKGALFIETVRTLMNEVGDRFDQIEERPAPRTAFQAGVALCEVIRAFLEHLLREDEPQGCRMLCRELLSTDTENASVRQDLVQSFVEEFMRPLHNRMRILLKALAPSCGAAELDLAATSVVGQCLIYTTHRPFLEYLLATSFGKTSKILQLEEHVSRFSLRAVGCDPEFINAVVAAARELPNPRPPKVIVTRKKV